MAKRTHLYDRQIFTNSTKSRHQLIISPLIRFDNCAVTDIGLTNLLLTKAFIDRRLLSVKQSERKDGNIKKDLSIYVVALVSRTVSFMEIGCRWKYLSIALKKIE